MMDYWMKIEECLIFISRKQAEIKNHKKTENQKKKKRKKKRGQKNEEKKSQWVGSFRIPKDAELRSSKICTLEWNFFPKNVFELHYRRLNMGRQRIGWVIITSPRNF
jgi:hypothetical protein